MYKTSFLKRLQSYKNEMKNENRELRIYTFFT